MGGRHPTPPAWLERTLFNISEPIRRLYKVVIDADGIAHIVVVGYGLWDAKLDMAGNRVERRVIADSPAGTALAHNAKDDIVVLYATPP